MFLLRLFYLVETHMFYLTEVVIWQKMAVFVLCMDLILVTRKIRNWKRIGGVRESDRERLDSHVGSVINWLRDLESCTT